MRARSFRVPVIRRTLAWTTGSLTCVRRLIIVMRDWVYTRGLGTQTRRQRVSAAVLTRKNSHIFLVLLTGFELGSMMSYNLESDALLIDVIDNLPPALTSQPAPSPDLITCPQSDPTNPNQTTSLLRVRAWCYRLRIKKSIWTYFFFLFFLFPNDQRHEPLSLKTLSVSGTLISILFNVIVKSV